MNEQRSLRLLPVSDASLELDCSVQHVRLLIRQGRLSAYKVGRDWLIQESGLVALKEQRYQLKERTSSYVREPQIESLFSEPELQGIVNVASVPQRSPFRYPGGKTWLIPTVRSWLSHQKVRPRLMLEPFAGGGGISLMTAMEGYSDRATLVELDEDVAAVWQVLFDGQGPVLADKIIDFAFCESTVRACLDKSPESTLDKAFLTILRNRVSRGGILAPGAGLVKSGEAGRGMASRWYPETLAKRILQIHGQRSKFSVVQGDGLASISAHKFDSNAVMFIDPPYPVAGRRLYRHHQINHRSLFERLVEVSGDFLATYDHNPDIESLAKEFGFATRLIPMKSTHHAKKFELLISRSFDWFPVTS